MVLGKTTAPEAMAAGTLRIEGDPSRLAALFAMLDKPGGVMFDILTPGEGRC
jgi:alkyl sulfatase BDS1-like metallo-beta-lactamase superfamily hydrolase